MELVLAIDLGTSYFKVGLFDAEGMLHGLGHVAVPCTHPQPERRELTVKDYIDTLKQAIREAITQARGYANQDPAQAIRAVSYASQANSFLLLEKGNKPVTPFILWPDRRAEPVDRLIDALWRDPDYHHTVGHGFHMPELFVPKLRWIQMRRPDLWFPAELILTISDYLVLRLTGQARGDRATAQMLGIWDMHRDRWSAPVLKTLGLRRRQLAEVLPPGRVAGFVQPEAAQEFGIPAGIPVAVGTLDHHAAALGAGLDTLAPMSESTGTVLAAVRSSEHYLCHPEYTVGPGPDREIAPLAQPFYWLAFDNQGATALEVYHRCFAADVSLKSLLNQAAGLPPGCSGLLLDPEASHLAWTEPGLAPKGFIGARSLHGPAHYVRAILECRALRLERLTHILFGGVPPEAIVATGGGSRSDLWLQIKSDMLNVKMIRPECVQSAALGAALFAAVAAGWHADLDRARAAMVRAERSFVPDEAHHALYQEWKSTLPANTAL